MKIYKERNVIKRNSLRILFFLRFMEYYNNLYKQIKRVKVLIIQRETEKRKKLEEKKYLEFKRQFIKKTKSTRVMDSNTYIKGKLRRVIV